MHTETTIHNVASIEVTDRKWHDGTLPFYCREIIIVDEDGNTHTISLFTKNEDEDTALKVRS